MDHVTNLARLLEIWLAANKNGLTLREQLFVQFTIDTMKRVEQKEKGERSEPR